MSLQDPSKAGCYKEFDKCCFCIDLKAGAHVLGIFAILGAVAGVIELILFFSSQMNFQVLAAATLGLCSLFPAIAYGMMLARTSPETKERFALWYLLGVTAGATGYLVFFIFSGSILIGIITYVIQLCLIWYFYCCLKSYASKDF